MYLKKFYICTENIAITHLCADARVQKKAASQKTHWQALRFARVSKIGGMNSLKRKERAGVVLIVVVLCNMLEHTSLREAEIVHCRFVPFSKNIFGDAWMWECSAKTNKSHYYLLISPAEITENLCINMSDA